MADSCALVFPGQGSQRVGMASDFVREHAESAAVFEEAGDVLGFDVFAVCNSEDEALHQTEFTQPCILTAEIAMLRGLPCFRAAAGAGASAGGRVGGRGRGRHSSILT